MIHRKRCRYLTYFLFVVAIFWTSTLMNMSKGPSLYIQDAASINTETDILYHDETQLALTTKSQPNLEMFLKMIMKKIDHLEKRIDQLTNQKPPTRGIDFPEAKANKPIEEDPKCKLDGAVLKKDFPHCMEKIKWMGVGWKTHSCYKDSGVDGSFCSFVIYLSEVEKWCPWLTWRPKPQQTVQKSQDIVASVVTNIDGLMSVLQESGKSKNYAWIKSRLHNLWSYWMEAANKLLDKQSDLKNRKQKTILVHLGLLSHKGGGFKIGDLTDKGGPLGELVQWSDLLATLYILGHNLRVTSEQEQLQQYINHHIRVKSPCANGNQLPLDIIYTDITGLKQFKRLTADAYSAFKCKLRVVDSFGTEPAFNHEMFSKTNRMVTQWGRQNLIPQQFFTMFPHTPDNSFMGFVVDLPLRNHSMAKYPKKNQAIVYGKNDRFWKDKSHYLDVIHQFVDLHGTVYIEKGKQAKYLPAYVKNHGLLSPVQLQQLLWQSKVFIGLGFPYEGPAPLEAIASGCVFINPSFNPPHTSLNTMFFKGKPTRREVSSQHSYVADHIGPPHVYTVDIKNDQEIKRAINKALQQSQVPAYLPYELTEGGMLQRMNYYIEKQDFCSDSIYVPEKAVKVFLADSGTSCKDFCRKQGRVCEPSHFTKVNDVAVIETMLPGNTKCVSNSEHAANILFPAFRPSDKHCILQQDRLLFSCVGSDANLNRVCPCRTFQNDQTALCDGCL